MTQFNFRDGRLFAEDVDVVALAQTTGTPFYCYSAAALTENYRRFANAVPGALIAYSVKANGNLAVLKTLAKLGAGTDVVSGGELRKALAAGIPPERIVFSGVGKTAGEIELGLHTGIYQFNVEGEAELECLSEVSQRLGSAAPVALRINPDIDARTHAKISTGHAETKFGIPWMRARKAYAGAARLPGIEIVGVDLHIGSQIEELEPFDQAFARIRELVSILRSDGHRIDRADLGGGVGVRYEKSGASLNLSAYAERVQRLQRDLKVSIVLEPGRAIAADAGILVSRIIYVKEGESRRFAIIDAGMNDFLRPALYDAHHEIVCLAASAGLPAQTYEVVGPVCETSDSFGVHALPPLEAGNLVAILMTGAYGAAMASAYNARPPAAEVLVSGSQAAVVRPRMSDDEFIGLDRIPDWLA